MRFLSAMILFLATSVYAGTESVGGGDLCEARIKSIRDDLKSWITRGGAARLTLPENVSLNNYNKEMLSQMDRAKISCVGPGDPGHPLVIQGVPKVCVFDLTAKEGRITCDYNKFRSISDSDQYVLIHHEYAGLSKIEVPSGSDSIYTISNQISGTLTDQIIKKISVKPTPPIVIPQDSDWKICKGKVALVLYEKPYTVVLNVYEYTSGMERIKDLTLLFGGYVLKGTLDTNSIGTGKVLLLGDDHTSFEGTVNFTYLSKTININGVFELNAKTSAKGSLECETLYNN